jgi:hypothetical protein
MAFRMEKLPSTIVIHKRVDTLDTCFAKMEQNLAERPLEQTLGFIDFGRYQKADVNSDHAFVRVNDMWDEQVDADEDSDDDEAPATAQNQAAPAEEADAATDIPPQDPEAEAADAGDRTQTIRIRSRRGPTRNHQAVTFIRPTTRRETLTQLWTQTEASKDKLYFIQEKETGKMTAKWYLIQVDTDETRRKNALQLGEYHVRWMIKNDHQAKTKKTRLCAFWPLIRELLPNGYFGAIVMFQPQKALPMLAKKPLKYAWYQREINLAELKLHGPFDFDVNFTIKSQEWDALKTAADKPDNHVDVTDINQIVPLKTTNK